MVQFIDGIASIADRYDGFVLDVWGVLHNGVAPYPHVVAALEELNRAGKHITLLSNAPMRAEAVAARIEEIGISRTLFQHVLSSGEEVWQALHDRTDPFYAGLGNRCLWLGPDRHGGMVQNLSLETIRSPADADFILNTGPDDLDDEVTALRPLLKEAARRKLPMICANPDLHVVHGEERIVCAGQVAKIYESMGGAVRWHGKPFPSVYETCLHILGLTDRRRVLAVGDSLRTDVAGAAGAGLDSLLLAGGIHAGEFGWTPGKKLDPAVITRLIKGGPEPTYIGTQLVW